VARRTALEAEATATATHLAQIATSGRKIWFYDGSEVGDLLKRHLSSALPQPRMHPVSGPFHIRVLEYGGAGFRPRPAVDCIGGSPTAVRIDPSCI
jgi:hypothetical protein